MTRDCGDILDRYTISWLKKDRIGSEENKKEFDYFQEEIINIKKRYPEFDWDRFIKFMYDINDNIWKLEAGLKGGLEEIPCPFYILSDKNDKANIKIGITAILNRNFNNLRISFKNIINNLTNEGFMDVKKDHV